MTRDDATSTRFDPRPGRTRAAILRAVDQLLLRGAQDVTVQDVAAEAGISRTTFYSQFRDLDDLATQLMGAAFAQIETLDLELRGTTSPLETARRTTGELVAHFEARAPFYAAVLSWGAGGAALRAAQDVFAAQALGTMREAAPPDVNAEMAADYVAAGSIALLATWLRSRDPAPAHIIQHHLIALLPAWLVDGEHPPTTA